MSILSFASQTNTSRLPEMELFVLHYYPQSIKFSGSVSAEVHVQGLGTVEMKGFELSEETKNAIRSDCITEMKKRLGL